MQISSKIINNILKIEENFLELLNEKMKYFNKLIFNNSGISKPRINMTTKDSSYKQIIIPMGNDNTKKIMNTFSKHVTNLNGTLKCYKTSVWTDFG